MATTPLPPLAMIVPASPNLPSSAPPMAPWWLATKRGLMPLIALLPFLFTAVSQMVSSGALHIPPEYASLWAVLVIGVQVYSKARTEQARQDAGQTLAAVHGLPVGQPLAPSALRDALYTSATLTPPAAPVPIRPDPPIY